jgi:hypothetical protein
LGDLPNLERLVLFGNRFTGPIPGEVGNLANLWELSLSGNRLEGDIPAELGALGNLQFLYLDGNLLTGPIPVELGNLVNLAELNLQNNDLRDCVPDSFFNLTALGDNGGLDIGCNALSSDSHDLTVFLRSKDKDWARTQTVPPKEVRATTAGTDSILLGWEAIAYTEDPGGYRVYFSADPSGPFTFFGQTASKTATSMKVTGLLPRTTYYFYMTTFTDVHEGQANPIESDPSRTVSAETAGRK